MAVTINSRSVEMTATSDAITLPYKKMIVGINFQGTGLTAGQRVTLRDTATVGTGNRLADYETEAATDNGDLWGGRSPQTPRWRGRGCSRFRCSTDGNDNTDYCRGLCRPVDRGGLHHWMVCGIPPLPQ